PGRRHATSTWKRSSSVLPFDFQNSARHSGAAERLQPSEGGKGLIRLASVRVSGIIPPNRRSRPAAPFPQQFHPEASLG
ncbi:hypothetical protein PV773_18815, partial [Mesorhizobium sp. CC13]|uniref:hypothetical protein n=1 Tax=Mesorhizobium sp. CC13 TaxID=3029194 RepID=UPI0032633FFC